MSRLTCQECGHESITNKSFLDLNLSLSVCSQAGPVKVAASPSPILPEQTAPPISVAPTAVFNIVDFLLKEENPMGESTVPLTAVDITAAAAVTATATAAATAAAATAASKARPRGRPSKGKKPASSEPTSPAGGPISPDLYCTGQSEGGTVAVLAPPVVKIVQGVEVVEGGAKEFSAEGEEVMMEGLLSLAPSPTPADSVSLSDCMRSFTTLEKLSEKIVSYRIF